MIETKKFKSKLTYLFISIALTSFTTHLSIAGVNPQLQLQSDWSRGHDTYGAGVFLPFIGDSANTPFLDLRYYQNENEVSNTSVGLGYRHGLSDHNYIGMNAYYDDVHVDGVNNEYQQASIGMEYSVNDWQINTNYYSPLNDKKARLNEQNKGVIHGNHLGINTVSDSQEMLASADMEVGHTLWQDDKHLVKMFVGGYWQERKNTTDNMGVRLKSEYDTKAPHWFPKGTSLGFGSYIEHDNENDIQAGVQLILNFGMQNTNDSINLQQVRRQLVTEPNTYRTSSFEKASNLTGKVKEFAFNNINKDVQTVNQQIAELGKKGIALISGSVKFSDSLVVGDTQTLLGAGGVLPIETTSGKTSQFIYKANPAVIRNSNKNTSVIQVSSNSVIKNLTTKGGAEGVGRINQDTNTKISHVNIHNMDISQTSGDGIKLDNTDGLIIKNTKIHNLTICDNNTACEFSVFSPAVAPNAAISAIGSTDIDINNVDIQNVTYGIFLASDFDENTGKYKTTTSNVNIDNSLITNSRREGLLLVGADGVKTNHLTIDNSQQETDMDLVVLQGSHDVRMENTQLSGGINGLMIINSDNLPSYKNTDVFVKNMTINNPSRSGVFINPASNISLEDVVVNKPKLAGLSLFGNEWMGGPAQNITLSNFQVNNPLANTLTFFGPAKNIHGEIKTTQASDICQNQWSMGSLEQENGNVLKINGKELKDLSNCSN